MNTECRNRGRHTPDLCICPTPSHHTSTGQYEDCTAVGGSSYVKCRVCGIRDDQAKEAGEKFWRFGGAA